jgi:hypothetical protein
MRGGGTQKVDLSTSTVCLFPRTWRRGGGPLPVAPRQGVHPSGLLLQLVDLLVDLPQPRLPLRHLLLLLGGEVGRHPRQAQAGQGREGERQGLAGRRGRGDATKALQGWGRGGRNRSRTGGRSPLLPAPSGATLVRCLVVAAAVLVVVASVLGCPPPRPALPPGPLAAVGGDAGATGLGRRGSCCRRLLPLLCLRPVVPPPLGGLQVRLPGLPPARPVQDLLP